MTRLFFCGNAIAALDDKAVTLRFLVRANPSDLAPRCSETDVDDCRDDLDLNQVFDALNRMAAGFGRSPFNGRAGSGAVQVILGPGVFRPQRELVISDWSGLGKFGLLHVTGAGADKTLIVGTVAVPQSSWELEPSIDPRIPAGIRSSVRSVNLSKLIELPAHAASRATGFDHPISPVRLEVFANDRPMTLARWPNIGWARINIPKFNSALGSSLGSLFSVRDAHWLNWKKEPDLFVSGYFAYDWAFERLPIAVINSSGGLLFFEGVDAKFGFRHNGRIVVENSLSELDMPGEWYFDDVTKILHLWPPEPNSQASVEISWLKNILNIRNSSDVTVKNLGFQGSTGDAVHIRESRNVSFMDAVVRNTGNRAVVVDGGYAVALRRIAMMDLGDGGVLLTGGDRRTLRPANHVVEGCRIERFSRLSRSYRPAIAVEGVGVQLLRNRIANGPHAAIIFGGNDHRIEGNHISDVVTETTDAGAIYTGRDWTARGTLITNNLLQNIYDRLPGTKNVMGIYLDDQASGITVSGNVFANLGRAVLIGGGRDNLIEHNIFVDSSTAIFVDNRGTTWQRDETLDPSGQLRRNLRNMPVASDAYRVRYLHLENILNDEPGRSKYNRAINNIFVSTRDYEFLDDAQTGIERTGNRTMPWSVFKTLRARKQVYTPQDFDLIENGFNPDRVKMVPFSDQIVP